ncbi:MAG: hypothetical protein HKM90_06640, partial [Desulfobacteraceae bacterium]|nr:hypothetical protein [Desulfobacteraceae bacterium]
MAKRHAHNARRAELFSPDRALPIRGKKFRSVISVSRTSPTSGRLTDKYLGLLISVIILNMLVNCSTAKTTYYKPGGDQYKFDIDSERCLGQAEIMARTKMVNPNREPDPKFVQKYYEGCLYARGWSKIPLDQRERS